MSILARIPKGRNIDPLERSRRQAAHRKQQRVKKAPKAKKKSQAAIQPVLDGKMDRKSYKDAFVGVGKQITTLFQRTDDHEDRLKDIEEGVEEVVENGKSLFAKILNPMKSIVMTIALISTVDFKVKPSTSTLTGRLFNQDPNANFVVAPVGTSPIRMYSLDPATTAAGNKLATTSVMPNGAVCDVTQYDGANASDTTVVAAFRVVGDGTSTLAALCTAAGMTITTASTFCQVLVSYQGEIISAPDLTGAGTVAIVDQLMDSSDASPALKAAAPLLGRLAGAWGGLKEGALFS